MKNKLISLLTTLCITATMFGTFTVTASTLDTLAFAQCTEHENHDEYTLFDEQYLHETDGYLNTGKFYLNSDVSTSDDILIYPGADVIICLNGHKLTLDGTQNNISTLNADCNLTIQNGSIEFKSSYQYSILFRSGTLTINNCNLLSNAASSIIYADNQSNTNIINSKISGIETSSVERVLYQADGKLNISNSEICDITTNAATDMFGIYLNSGSATITNSSIYKLSNNNYTTYGIYADSSSANINIQNTAIYDLSPNAESTNNNPLAYAIYLDSESASIKDCSRIEHCIYNNSAHISEISNLNITCNDMSLSNSVNGIIDKIENCNFTSDTTSVHNSGTISSISGSSFTTKSQISTNAALLNNGTITSITDNSEFHGVNAIKNEDSGTITIDSADVIGTVFSDWESQDKIYSYAINPSSGGTVIINNGNFGCASYQGDDENDLKLFPSNASGITINGGNFQIEIPSSLIAAGYVNTASNVEQFPYTIGEADYNINYNLDGGTNNANNPTSYTISTGVTLFYNPTKSGYTFKGWQDSTGNPITSIAIGTTGDITLTAIWEKDPVYYNVTLTDITGFTADKQNVTLIQEGSEYKVTLTPISDDYLVNTYDTYIVIYTATNTPVDGAAYEYSTANRTASIIIPNVQGDVSIICKAQLCTHDYNRTVNVQPTCTESGSATDICKVCQKVVSPVILDPLGHNYTYSSEGNKITEICENNCGHTATAILSIESKTVTSVDDYKVSAEYSENWAGSESSVTYEKNGQQVNSPEGAGAYKASITFGKATASVEYYTVSFYDETNLLETQIILKNDMASIPTNPTKSNYTFDIWSTTAGETTAFDFNTSINAETTVYAVWIADTYKIVLDTNEGTINKGEITSYTYGTGAMLPTDVTKPGYTFSGWYDNKDLTGNAITSITSSDSGDKTYYAKWTKDPPSEYTITFVNFDGTILQSKNVPVNTIPAYSGTEPTKPQDDKYTYTFSGWDPKLSAVIGFETYTAQFTAAARAYNVILNANEGTINSGNITIYTYGTSTALPTDLQRDGYIFDGWFDNFDCTGNAVTEISSTDTGDKVYYAKWTIDPQKEYLITFVNDDNTELQSIMVKVGEKPVYTGSTPTKASDNKYTYTFSGWSPEIVPVRSAATYRAVYVAADITVTPSATPDAEPTETPDMTPSATPTATPKRSSAGNSSGKTIPPINLTAAPASTQEPNAIPTNEPLSTNAPLANPFSDITENNWFYEPVLQLFEEGLISGISDSEFAPYMDITRGMFVTVLYRMENEPQSDFEYAFEDVPADEYFSKAVAWASENKIVEGYSGETYEPYQTIIREQMAAIIYRYARYKGYDMSVSADISYFDSESISDYALEAVKWTSAQGIMYGNTDNTFMPLSSATRAEAAAVFARISEKF